MALLLLSLILSVLVAFNPVNSRPKKPPWNYLIKETTTTQAPTLENDHLVIPSSVTSGWNNHKGLEKVSKTKQTTYVNKPSNDNFLSFIKYGVTTSTKAVSNYYTALSKMFTGGGSSVKEKFDEPSYVPSASSSSQKTRTKFGTKQEFTEDDKIKAVVLRGKWRDEDSYEKEDKEGWGIGDLFWGAFYGPANP